MKHVIVVLILLFAGVSNSIGQEKNLVPNPGFEVLDSCPKAFGEVHRLKYWENYHYTPDLFHECAATKYVKVPINFFGQQAPASGRAYAGITVYHQKYPNEIIGVKLKEPLQKGISYEARIKVSLAERYSRYATNNLGFLFTNEPRKAYNGKKVHVSAIEIISETQEWVTIGGVFVPDKTYQYMMIGNFFDHADTKRKEINPTVKYAAAYYYIDEVYVAKKGNRMSFSSSTLIAPGNTYRLDNVLFDFDKAILKSFSKTELLKLANLLQKNPSWKIQISGHTDNIGTEKDNMDLSLRRAQAVINFLVNEGNIKSQRLKAKGWGETQPVITNKTASGRARNRRVEFKILTN
ncbi:hypothetical protein BKI52_34305 [marine bacterium AO1-C]|nr:hypothetical protein BKI52_34305 [marine bacterium AO1-C]